MGPYGQRDCGWPLWNLFLESGSASVLESCTFTDLDPLWHLRKALDTTGEAAATAYR